MSVSMSASPASEPSAARFARSSARRPASTGRGASCRPCPPASQWPGADPAVLEKRGPSRSASLASVSQQTGGTRMIDSLRISQIYVLDQDQALDFYVGKLGLEKNTDEDLGFMRFLTVSVPGDRDRQV